MCNFNFNLLLCNCVFYFFHPFVIVISMYVFSGSYMAPSACALVLRYWLSSEYTSPCPARFISSACDYVSAFRILSAFPGFQRFKKTFVFKKFRFKIWLDFEKSSKSVKV
jgi:hypothetical protein